MNRFSLVILTSNRPEALTQCLRSIERLTWDGPALQIIVVHDDSFPVPLWKEKFSPLKIKFVPHMRTGVSVARNRGLENATGDYVGFVADDYILPHSYLKDVHGFFMAHPEEKVITHNIKPKGWGPFVWTQQLYMQLALGQELPAKSFGEETVASFTLPASRGAVFKRDIFATIGSFDETLKTGEDSDISRRLAKTGAPINMFRFKSIEYDESRSGMDYLRLRMRYGRSYVQVLGSAKSFPEIRRYGLAGIPLRVWRKIGVWWPVAKRIRSRLKFVLLFPWLTLFLGFYFYGAFLELRTRRR